MNPVSGFRVMNKLFFLKNKYRGRFFIKLNKQYGNAQKHFLPLTG